MPTVMKVVPAVVLALAAGASVASAASRNSVELAVRTSPSGGSGGAVAFVRGFEPWLSVFGTAELGQREYVSGEIPSIDLRLGYVGVGSKLRLFPKAPFGWFATAGVAAGHLSFPAESTSSASFYVVPPDPEWRAFPWTGLGFEVRAGRRMYIGAEARVEFVRPQESEMPIRVTVRVPLGDVTGR